MLQKVCKQIDDLNPRKVIGIFLLVWIILNIVQSFFTELAHDEAYYWLFSKKLDWGYFDHPPMIALLIKIGYALIPNELGVRLIPLILGTSTIYLIYLLIEDELTSLSTFILVVSSIIIVQSHVGGFLAIPDVPVIFFATLFLFLYKKYINQDNIKLAIVIGLVSAAMLYSKYHGVLVLFFSLISNLSILKRKTFYIIPVVIAIAMLPHLFWQIENNFPTFEYHLVGRSMAYTFHHTLNYLYSQFLIAGPFVSIIVFYHAVKVKANKNVFQQVLKFNFYGFFIFFFFMSFKGHTEAHWTAFAFVPLVLLSVNGIYRSERALRWMRILFIPTFIAFIFLRFSLVFDIIPKNINLGREFHNWDTWAQEIKEEANGRTVVFNSSFQRPAKYSFYTNGEFSHSFNHVLYRKNQFDLWGYTDSIQGKDIILFRVGSSKDSIYTSAVSEEYSYKLMDDFVSYNQIPIIVEEKEIECEVSDTISLNIAIVNNTQEVLDLTKIDNKSPRFNVSYSDGLHNRAFIKRFFIDTSIAALDTAQFIISFEAPKNPGEYSAYVSIVNDGLYPGFNSKPFIIEVK